jgi:threonyl-tRNA synthetase
MLQRIYGTVFPSKAELDAYLERMEEARLRDHRRLGRDLDLFIFDDDIGPGLPLWLPKGNVLREELEKLALEKEHDYVRVSTPHIAKEQLYLRSGHLPYYREDMFAPSEQEGANYYLKPMNCPFHHKIFGDRQRSYRELPMRLAEYGMVYRYEASGSLFGLMRVRAAQQNDAHIYCTEAQFESEFMRVIDLYRFYFDLFGIEKFIMQLSKHAPQELGNKYVDEPEMWLKMEALVRDVMVKADVPFVELEDEAAFYGPKIDVQVWSAVGREFSLATNQVDFVQPARFDLTYVDRDGSEKTPLCIHRAPLGSHERFVGFLIEHYGGAFPVWLAPVQAVVIPIADRHVDYAYVVRSELREAGLRVEVEDGPERMNKKIRNAQQQKVPYMLVVGDRESAENSVAIRTRENEDRGALPLAQFKADVLALIQDRSALL